MKRISNLFAATLALASIFTSCEQAEEEVAVASVTISQPSAEMIIGETLTLTATISPSNATEQEVTWASSQQSVATVDNKGLVAAIAVGETIITATAGGKTAVCQVTVKTNLAPSETIGAEKISAICAVLKGKANLSSSEASDLKVGFQYSKSAGILPSNSTTIEATDADAAYNYTAVIANLEPATQYYFRSFVRQNGQDTYGETKLFTTKGLSSLLATQDATEVKAASAKLNGMADLTDVSIAYKTIEYGFYWGTSESSQPTKLGGGSIVENTYSASLTNLSHKTQYWYKAYVNLDNQTFYGEVKTFTTDVVPVESVSLDKTEHAFNTTGNTLTLKATVIPADATNKSVEWTSSDNNVVTVTSSGVVKAVGNGTATIIVTTKDQGKTATCAITVAQVITSISFDKTTLSLNEGEEYTLTATVKPDNAVDKSLKWTSTDESVATVNQAGKVTAKSKGTATIKAEAQDGSKKYAACQVSVIRLVSSVTLDKTSIVLYTGKTEKITATILPSDANNTGITWTSSNTSKATVSSAGVVTGKAVGNVTITAKAKDASGKDAKCEVEVRQSVTSISLDKTSLLLDIGDTETLVATVSPSNAYNKELDWSIDNKSVATVNNGSIKALAKGKATITVSAKDGSGISAKCDVVVSSACPKGAVDLGFRTSDGYRLYWSKSNLSTSGLCANPEEYGDYYAWGEIETKAEYVWSTYKFGTSSSGTPFSKYNTNSSYGTVDNKTVLSPEDDVAHVKLGGEWRIPTNEEWRALLEQCKWYEDTQNGEKGKLVIAPNGNSIFLPAAGYWDGTSFCRVGVWGPIGNYWSSSLYASPSCAYFLEFIAPGDVYMRDNYRYYGRSVRPVCE